MANRGKSVLDGALAGAVATLALDAATYTDMFLTGRSPSELPERAARPVVTRLFGHDEKTPNRTAGLAPLMGYSTGVGFGAAAGWFARKLSARPFAVRVMLAGAGAMAAGQVAATLSGLTDPRKWTSREWAEDIVPHLAYGLAYAMALSRLRG